jgi:hypothetical protein
MAYVVTIRWKGATPDEYERVSEAGDVGYLMSGAEEGAIAHIATFDDDGLYVIDVWERPEQFEQFVADRLMPAIEKAGVDRPPPEVEIREIHKAKVFAPAAVA